MYEYETIYITKPDIPVARAEKIAEKVQKILTENKAKIELIKDWGKRKLAYPIAKNSMGHYFMVSYAGTGSFIGDLERILKFDEDVVRYMTIKKGSVEENAKKAGPKKHIELEEAHTGFFDISMEGDFRQDFRDRD